LASGGDQISFLTVPQAIDVTNAVVHFTDGVTVSIDGPTPSLIGVAHDTATAAAHHHII
jgi:hypothetical protein